MRLQNLKFATAGLLAIAGLTLASGAASAQPAPGWHHGWGHPGWGWHHPHFGWHRPGPYGWHHHGPYGWHHHWR